jgi:hypothetical protein
VAQLRARRDQVAVVRVEVRDAAAGSLIVDLLEVGRERGADRRIGRAADPATAGQILCDWLIEVLARARDAGPTAEPGRRRSGDVGVTLVRRSRKNPARR